MRNKAEMESRANERSMEAHICDSSTWEMEAGEARVQG